MCTRCRPRWQPPNKTRPGNRAPVLKRGCDEIFSAKADPHGSAFVVQRVARPDGVRSPLPLGASRCKTCKPGAKTCSRTACTQMRQRAGGRFSRRRPRGYLSNRQLTLKQQFACSPAQKGCRGFAAMIKESTIRGVRQLIEKSQYSIRLSSPSKQSRKVLLRTSRKRWAGRLSSQAVLSVFLSMRPGCIPGLDVFEAGVEVGNAGKNHSCHHRLLTYTVS